MRIIALEEHVLPKDLNDLGNHRQWVPARTAELLDDLADGRLAAMDEAGIDLQVLSFVGHAVQELDTDDAARLSRRANKRIAAAVAAHPARFAGFAQLPMGDPSAAVYELSYALNELGLLGVMVHGQTRGRFLDHPDYDRLLAAVERAGVPIYLHPAEPPPAVHRAYYSDLPGPVAQVLSTAGWGWHAELGMHVLRMAAAGTFESHPGLRMVVGHMGENLPFSLARADEWLSPVTGLDRGIADTVLDHVWITTAGYTTQPPLLCALQVFGEERVLFSVDYPFSSALDATRFLRAAPMAPTTREKIAHTNAQQLLGLAR